jgi:hypothetical protein
VNTANSSPNSLQQSLTRLHTDLAATPRLDESSKQSLREALQDIERVLQDQTPAAQGPRSRLEELAVRFDVGHPTLSAGIRELVDLLSGAGL